MHYDSAISFDKNLKRDAERIMLMVREEVQERVNQDVVRANYEDLELFEVFDGWVISPHSAGLTTYPATYNDLRQKICAAVCEASGWDILDCQRRQVIKPTEVI